jgi:hypothetical protein
VPTTDMTNAQSEANHHSPGFANATGAENTDYAENEYEIFIP